MAETVLVTGVSRGLGEALASCFKEAGHRIVVVSRNPLPWSNGYRTVIGDLRWLSTLLSIERVAFEESVSILINNAGVYHFQPFELTSDELFREVIETNLVIPILVTKAVYPAFKLNGGGLVVNINSVAGQNGSSGETAYCASKFGLRGFSKALQLDAMKDNVRVLEVYLGGMRTDMTKERHDWDNLMDPVEVAQSIVRLCRNWKSMQTTEVTLIRRNRC